MHFLLIKIGRLACVAKIVQIAIAIKPDLSEPVKQFIINGAFDLNS